MILSFRVDGTLHAKQVYNALNHLWRSYNMRKLVQFAQSILFLLPFSYASSSASDFETRCTSLKNFHFENTTILDAATVAPLANFSVPGTCQSSATNGNTTVCRVQIITNTTSTSSVHMEAWLPDDNVWNKRFLGLGNGGLGGCKQGRFLLFNKLNATPGIDYDNLPYGTSFGFATIGSDNGHDGNSGIVFLNHPEVINDFAFRAVHTEVLVGKALVKAFYGTQQKKSYYLGCSTGGRQGIHSAQIFPQDFDGIVAGSPAIDFNHLLAWGGIMGTFVGDPHANTSDLFITPAQWAVISTEILNQCDALDGLVDGIITEPDACDFRPETLICPQGRPAANATCLSTVQVETLRKIHSPLFGSEGQLLFTRWEPGAEGDGQFEDLLSGTFLSLVTVFLTNYSSSIFYSDHVTQDWFSFTVYNTTDHDFSGFGLPDVAAVDAINPGGIASWDGDLTQFKDRGGKLLTYHGRRDQVCFPSFCENVSLKLTQLISGVNSKRFYNLVSQTLQTPNLDDFYRLFLIPGMEHCSGGPGAWAFGQGGLESAVINDPAHNILLAIVDWVENDVSPDTMIGSVPGNATAVREHCRYPQRSVLNGTTFTCVPVP